MPEYMQQISSPSLQGLSISPMTVDSGSKAATANAITTVLSAAASLYGRSEAKERGVALAGEETYETAGAEAERAKTELESLITTKEAQTGKKVTEDQARDLKNEVFGKVLNNYKRIEGALKRGVITSTEANARLAVLRNEALSNPLVAPFQDELDNAMFKATGGSSGTFKATAAEQEAAAVRKGNLAAVQAVEEQVGNYIRTGLASSRKQALSLIAQQEQYKVNMQYYNEKKERLGVTSQEAYAASQTLSTGQAASAYSKITQWVSSGADAKGISGIRMALVQEGEQIKNAIRSSAVDRNGNLLVDQTTLRTQIDEVDQRVRDFSAMLDDQSSTKNLVRLMEQRTAALDYKNQDIHIELTKLAPLFMAMKDNQAASQWLWDNAINVNEMKNQWLSSSNPLLRMIGKLSPQDAEKVVNTVGEKVVKGAALNQDEQAVAAETLVNKGGVGAVQEAYNMNKEQTLVQLENIPFRLKDLSDNLEWTNLGKTEEGLVQLQAVIDGAARRAVISNFVDAGKTEGAVSDARQTRQGVKGPKKKPGDHSIPQNVVVKEKETTAPGRGPRQAVWEIDTGGVWVSDAYKSEVVNAYKLGKKIPTLWEAEYESVDDWINDLFSRNIPEEKTAE
jgi:hypothetical protein